MAAGKRRASLAVCLLLVAIAIVSPIAIFNDFGDDLANRVGLILWKWDSMDDYAVSNRTTMLVVANVLLIPVASLALAFGWGVRYAKGRRRPGDDPGEGHD